MLLQNMIKLVLTLSLEATREEMSAARVPLAYRDSCAHLLIPLNHCRYDNYYLPWRCMVQSRSRSPVTLPLELTLRAGRETFVREVPI